MIQVSIRNDFESWRAEARRLLRAGIEPHGVIWSSETQHALFESRIGPPNANTNILVPASFLELARAAACYDDPGRWDILYRLLFRLVYRKRDLLEIDSDADVHRVRLMEKAVKRDVHKFHAFVRFRKVEFAGDELFVAWHEPHHFTVERAVLRPAIRVDEIFNTDTERLRPLGQRASHVQPRRLKDSSSNTRRRGRILAAVLPFDLQPFPAEGGCDEKRAARAALANAARGGVDS